MIKTDITRLVINKLDILNELEQSGTTRLEQPRPTRPTRMEQSTRTTRLFQSRLPTAWIHPSAATRFPTAGMEPRPTRPARMEQSARSTRME